MNQILALREKRAKAWDAAKAFLDSKRGTDGLLSAEDSATYDRMEADVVNLGKEIDRLERQNALDVEMNKATSNILRTAPEAGSSAKNFRASDEYKANFWNAMRKKSISHEVFNALQVGTTTEGGYLVPDEFEHTLVMGLEDENIIRKLAHTIRTSSGERKIPVVTAHGIAQWTDEEDPYHESDEVFGQTSIGAHKLTTMIKVSEELLNDSVFDIPAYLSAEFARRIGAAEEEAFLTGNGTGKPTGIIGPAGVSVATAAAGKVSFDDVMDLYYGLKAGYRRKGAFLCNEAVVKTLRKLKNGNGDYIWQPSVVAGTPDTILGRPVYTTSYMDSAIQTGKVAMLFADMSYYWIADREGRAFQRLNELYATTGQVGFLASQRVDGKLILPEAAAKLTIA